MNRANNLDARFDKVQQDFYREIYGTKSQSARWKKCVDYVNNNMGMAVSALYVQEHFNSASKAKLHFESDKYFENVIGFLRNSTNKTQSKLYDEVDRDKWTVVPSVVNAHYHRYRNLMSFPAAVLQSPLFNKDYPNSLNYGAIGSIVGHELTHGFDSNGRHHDSNGNQRLWWHPNTIDRFIAKSQCMTNQYNNYTVRVMGEDHKINGILTLSEV
ncbi:unnamed protein product [Oppiella nova]|uniref:Peptidase M13 C-terminal domain-containing protein n=1 Tax=Oppiella nova TaxID=334625 RepID=A0A7R9QNQ2_9ACAR|nr:unnamed protein product [Oppiella nova]CAG2169815.1 unnamed protein product [Oppiella nova]